MPIEISVLITQFLKVAITLSKCNKLQSITIDCITVYVGFFMERDKLTMLKSLGIVNPTNLVTGFTTRLSFNTDLIEILSDWYSETNYHYQDVTLSWIFFNCLTFFLIKHKVPGRLRKVMSKKLNLG